MKLKKKALLLGTLPVLFLGTASTYSEPASSEPPASVSSATSSEVSAPVSSYPVSSEETTWEDIEVDGKPISQWMSELKDENTRMTAIIALATALGVIVFRFVLWLGDRKLTKAHTSASTETTATLNALKEYVEGVKAELSKMKEELSKSIDGEKEEVDKVLKEAEEKIVLVSEALEKSEENWEVLEETIIALAKTDPDLVKQSFYKQVKAIIDKHKKAKEETEDGGNSD